jgi:glycosyltransferase involved in cell wall biosynthesis
MKILWFTGTSSLYNQNKKKAGYNGGGWIESLERLITEKEDVKLGVSFFYSASSREKFKVNQGRTTYYPIALYRSLYNKIKHHLFYKDHDKIEINECLNIIEDFKPDIIHVFGSERSFGLLSKYTEIPVIIHLQGFLNSCSNTYFPPNTSYKDIIGFYLFSPFQMANFMQGTSFFRHNVNREKTILQECNYFLGRTQWDKDLAMLFNPQAKYFKCNEVLRPRFYIKPDGTKKTSQKLVLSTTISKAYYKGFDLVLKTAKILLEHSRIQFEWDIYGIDNFPFWQHKLGINPDRVNVKLRGVVDADTLYNQLFRTDIFICPSYIENSSNSICEAQLIGIPVIATNVGGTSSLISNGETGILVPANDPYSLASRIIDLYRYPEKADLLGTNARKVALDRHDREKILDNMMNIYYNIKVQFAQEKSQKQPDPTFL